MIVRLSNVPIVPSCSSLSSLSKVFRYSDFNSTNLCSLLLYTSEIFTFSQKRTIRSIYQSDGILSVSPYYIFLPEAVQPVLGTFASKASTHGKSHPIFYESNGSSPVNLKFHLDYPLSRLFFRYRFILSRQMPPNLLLISNFYLPIGPFLHFQRLLCVSFLLMVIYYNISFRLSIVF